MKLTDRIYLVGSGRHGFQMTDPLDCHVYLVDGGAALALIDAGSGRDVHAILAHIRADGFDPAHLAWVLLTHGHADHAAGAAPIRRRTGCRVAVSRALAAALRQGDADAISLRAAQAAGLYPPDFHFEACPVDRELDDGDRLAVGDLTLEVLLTPGHSRGDACYVLRHAGRTSLFDGDLVFFGGRILLQNIPDCDLQAYLRSIGRLAGLAVDGLFPGHGGVSIRGGAEHVAAAQAVIDRLGVPPSFI